MVQNHHDGGFVGAGVDFQVPADADEAGAVVALVLHGGAQTVQSVQLGAGAAGQGGNVLSAGLGDHLGGHGGVVHGNDIHAGETVEEVAALVDGLLVGIHFLDIGEVRAGINQKIVVDFQPEGADDGEIVLDHQVVHLVHGTGGGIFDGQNAVLAQPLIDGTEHGLKGLEVHNKGIFEDFFTGDLGVSALHALTGDHGRLREKLRRVLDGLRDIPVKGAAFPVALGLVAAAQLEQHGVQHPGVIGHFGAGLFRHVLKLRPFPGRLENGQVIGLFVVGDLSGDMHPLAEQANQFVVDFVDLTANLI